MRARNALTPMENRGVSLLDTAVSSCCQHGNAGVSSRLHPAPAQRRAVERQDPLVQASSASAA